MPAFDWSGNKDRWLPLVFEGFPHVEAEYTAAVAKLNRWKDIRVKYDGLLIARVTGLSGKELGQFKTKFEASLGPCEQKDAWLHQADAQTIENAVHAFQQYLENEHE